MAHLNSLRLLPTHRAWLCGDPSDDREYHRVLCGMQIAASYCAVTSRMIQHYTWAREAFGAPGVNTVNATVGGKLEVFPRVDYAGLFSG
jgi:hypothetical protein